MTADRPRPDKAQAIQLRAQGHSLRFIAAQLAVHHSTVADWLAEPEAADEVRQVTRDLLPDLEADATLARRYLRSLVEDEGATTKERTKAAAVLLANFQRAQAVATANRAVDAVEGQRVYTAEEVHRLEEEAAAALGVSN